MRSGQVRLLYNYYYHGKFNPPVTKLETLVIVYQLMSSPMWPSSTNAWHWLVCRCIRHLLSIHLLYSLVFSQVFEWCEWKEMFFPSEWRKLMNWFIFINFIATVMSIWYYHQQNERPLRLIVVFISLEVEAVRTPVSCFFFFFYCLVSQLHRPESPNYPKTLQPGDHLSLRQRPLQLFGSDKPEKSEGQNKGKCETPPFALPALNVPTPSIRSEWWCILGDAVWQPSMYVNASPLHHSAGHVED